MPRTGKKAPPIDRYGLHKQDNRGANTVLTPEILLQIEEAVKTGLTNPEIITLLAINEHTWYSWLYRDTQNIQDKIADWRRDYLLRLAEDGFSSLAKSKSERIRLDALKFLTERLGKRNWATRTESQAIDPDEGKEIEPENKEKIERLLITKKPLQTKDALPIVSPLQLDTNADK